MVNMKQYSSSMNTHSKIVKKKYLLLQLSVVNSQNSKVSDLFPYQINDLGLFSRYLLFILATLTFTVLFTYCF